MSGYSFPRLPPIVSPEGNKSRGNGENDMTRNEELRQQGLISLKEASERAGRSTSWVRTRIDDGRIGAIRESKRVYVTVADVDAQAGSVVAHAPAVACLTVPSFQCLHCDGIFPEGQHDPIECMMAGDPEFGE